MTTGSNRSKFGLRGSTPRTKFMMVTRFIVLPHFTPTRAIFSYCSIFPAFLQALSPKRIENVTFCGQMRISVNRSFRFSAQFILLSCIFSKIARKIRPVISTFFTKIIAAFCENKRLSAVFTAFFAELLTDGFLPIIIICELVIFEKFKKTHFRRKSI